MNLLLIMFLVVFMVPLIVAIIEEIKEPAMRNQALDGRVYGPKAQEEIERLREALEAAITYMELIGPSPQLDDARAALSAGREE